MRKREQPTLLIRIRGLGEDAQASLAAAGRSVSESGEKNFRRCSRQRDGDRSRQPNMVPTYPIVISES